MSWLKEVFATEKPVIAMCHLEALPGDPSYDPGKGLGWVIERARQNLRALQEGGVDAVMFSNESSLREMSVLSSCVEYLPSSVIRIYSRRMESSLD